ncbi:MAG: hypothetical protein ICV82_07350 [Nitrososphaera sp.]|nr:hypothetical protein [Nitrososphaera sp.]
MEKIQEKMSSSGSSTTNNIRDDDRNTRNSSNSSRSLKREADELAKSRNWTKDFALYVMFCKAMAKGDKIRAESCMKLLEQEFKNSFSNSE